MKAIIAAVIAMAVISTGSYAVLNQSLQRTADQAYATSGARVTPGH
jgi:Flp pilus assembly pilin Flp